MSKAIINQRQIYKNTSSRFKDFNWNLELDVETAKKNKEIVSINDSIALRMIRKMTGQEVDEKEIDKLKLEIKKLKKKGKTKANIEKIKQKYKELEDKILVKELNSIVFESIADWNRANSKKGIKLNKTNRIRTIGTSGGVKKDTVLFCEENIHEELDKKLNNGRNIKEKYVPAKFEAYKALAFSGSTPVTQPKGVLVIKDGEHEIESDVLLLSDNKKGGFDLSKKEKYKINRQFTDGCGMISKELSEKWAIDMGCYEYNDKKEKEATYIPSGFNIRNAFCKGMLFTFPFLEFAEEVAEDYMVEDAWGNMIDIRKVDVILTTNMLKLWKSYGSIDHYLKCCKENDFEFCVAKILPEKLENTRNMNYQFLESYNLTDDEIENLVQPTVDSIKGALSEDYLKMILFLKGCKLTKEDFLKEDYDYLKALMIDKRMKNDPFIQQKVYRMIRKKINNSKKGVIEVQGSYEVVSGDLYALCQYMYGMKVTGILKANEFYSRTWLDRGVNKIVAYRAPMTLHNNIKVMPLIENKDTKKWYRFMKTCLIINAWDCTAETMNGEDFDGDANITTDNKILIKNTRETLPIICEQKSAEKKKINKTLLKKANKNGFGNNVGDVTNKCTGMYDVLVKFKAGTPEYEEMSYRIACMQGYQQEIIDSIKGIIPKKVPSHWYNYKELKINYEYKVDKNGVIIKEKDDEKTIEWKKFNQKLLSNKKPYFFIYNYSKLKRKYKKYIENNNTNCLIKFGLTLDELIKKENKSEDEEEFIKYYNLMMPVSIEKSLMNRLCWILEDKFKDIETNIRQENNNFDYDFLKLNAKYSKKDKEIINEIYNEYKKEAKLYKMSKKNSDENEENTEDSRQVLIDKYQRKVFEVCNNEDMICDILLDICYGSSQNKQFVWDICGDTIIDRLLKKNNHSINVPIITNKITNTYWQGEYYELESVQVEEDDV
ncbi:TPA: RNA-dependent RNA polymerase [Clostridium botulinum]|nr:hypothetical protein [Clostridium botulinum]MBN3359364.1 hypothetical protein [Clostridium botulinum]QDY27233.1 hypothetical protein CGQ40_21130 [Clostridium botulinum]